MNLCGMGVCNDFWSSRLPLGLPHYAESGMEFSARPVILVAEDETLVRMTTSEMLEESGYQVYEARDGQEALTILEVRGGSADVLFSDITMPNLGGLDLAEIVHARWPHIGIVLCSGNAPADLKQLMPLDATFIGKPFREAEALAAVRAVSHRKSAAAPGVALHSFPTLRAGRTHGAGGVAQPLPEES